MKKLMLPFLLFPLFAIGGCTGNASKTESQKAEAQEPLVQTYTVERYKLFPMYNRAYIFISKWIIPIWIKLQVTVLHQSPVSVSGPKSAPHFIKEMPVGSIRLTPHIDITINNATFI